MVNFIGLGAQKAGTSWVYACLYEHPEICAPVKEIHFFSRPRFSQGYEWYENHFTRCAESQRAGEFSTSYLYSKETPARIHKQYPDVRLLAIVRNPIERAWSQYRNALKAGEITETVTFTQYCQQQDSVIEQGNYFEQLERYLKYFSREQLLVLVYEDSKKDPAAFISEIYKHVGVDSTFVPSMLTTEINIARQPASVGVERGMHKVAERLRRSGLDKLVWMIRKSGIPELVRSINTKPTTELVMTDEDRELVKSAVKDDVMALSDMLGRDLVTEWLS